MDGQGIEFASSLLRNRPVPETCQYNLTWDAESMVMKPPQSYFYLHRAIAPTLCDFQSNFASYAPPSLRTTEFLHR